MPDREAEDLTQRRQAEQSLQRLQAILDQSLSLVYVVDLEGKFTFANRPLAEILETEPEEIVGRTREAFLSPEITAQHRNNDLEVIRTGQALIREETTTQADATRTYLSVKFPLVDADGRITAVCGMSTDITLRKDADAALRESEERFASAFHTSPAAISITRVSDGLFVDANQAFLDLFEFSRDEVVGHTSTELELISAEERTRLIGEQMESGGLRNTEIASRSKSGRRLHLMFSSKPMKLGGELHYVTTLIDITERKQLEQDWRRFYRLAESSSEFIGMCDLDMQPLYVNPAGRRMVGLPDMEAACRVKVQDYFFPEDQAYIAEDFFPRVLRDGSGDLEIRLRHFETGEAIWLSYHLFSVHDETGEPIGWATVSHDLTERKRSEEERAQLQAQIAQAQKMESVGRLAGGVAHDFNNMLVVILGYTDIALKKVAPTDPLHRDLRQIREAAKRSADLTRQLLTFSRKQVTSPEVVDLNDTVEGMIKLLGQLIGENIRLDWRPGPDLWPVHVDPAQIDQVLANLCVNARDAIADVGTITITTENVSFGESQGVERAEHPPGDYVMLAVTDDGCGMDAETRSHLFEPFFTTKATGKGTGLGLASVYGAVKQSDGFIGVDTDPGAGTTIRIHLPRHAQAAPATAVPQQGPMVRGSETVLLVDDEPLTLLATARMLEELGYRVLTASTPGDAVRSVEENGGCIDLLMTDVVMPEMTGRDLADRILRRCPDIGCLFTSGYTNDVIAHHGVLDPGVHFIHKPLSLASLSAKLREVLAGRGTSETQRT